MKLDVEERGQIAAVVTAEGSLDLLNAGELRRLLESIVASGRSRIVLDLGAVSSFDSTALAALVSGLRAARCAGGDLVLARPADEVRLVLTLAKLESVFRCVAFVELGLLRGDFRSPGARVS